MSDVVPKFAIGDKVRIVNYGHLIWQNKNFNNEPMMAFPLYTEDENCWWLDMSPDLVGQIGIIQQATVTQGHSQYAIDGIKGKHAWYDDEQLEMISENPNTH